MKSLKTKLIILIIALVVTAHFATGGFIISQVKKAMHHENHRRGMAVALDLANTCAVDLISLDLSGLRSHVGLSMRQDYVVQAMIINPKFRIIMHNDLSKVGSRYDMSYKNNSTTYSNHYSFINGEQVIDIPVPIEVGGVKLGTAVISYSHAGVKKEISALKQNILFILLIGICVAVICAVLVGEYITKPLKHLCNMANKIGNGCFDIKRMDTEYTDEIGELADTFHKMADQLEKKVCHDALTGLFSRNIFQARLTDECAQSLRLNHPLAVMMIDVDHFKKVNDTYGHLAGDKVLQDIAQIMQSLVRGEDCVARYGGEEFVIMLPQTPKNGALLVAEKIRKKVERYPFYLEGTGTISLTISIGVAIFPEDTKDIKWLIELADQALYLAKRKGRNLICRVPAAKV